MIAERAALLRRLRPFIGWKAVSTPHGPILCCPSGQAAMWVDVAAMLAALHDSIDYLEESAPD